MRHALTILLLLALPFQTLAAQKTPLVFDGEEFRSKFSATTQDGDKLLEFVRKSETVHNWTKLVAFRYQKLPKLGNDPTKAAVEIAKVVKASNPKAGYSVLPGKKEAMVDFLTWPRHKKYVEFSVLRYAKSQDGKGLVSVKFGYRFSDTSPEGVKKFKKQRQLWLQEVAAFDLARVNASLAEQ